jgi:hypothetical protein
MLLTFLFDGYGQHKVLLITNKKTGKELVIHEGERLKVACKNGNVIRGRLIFNDTSKLIGINDIRIIHHDSNKSSIYDVNFNDIETIKSISLAGKIIGVTITVIGGVITITGIVVVATASGQFGWWADAVGIVTAGIGVIIDIVGVIVLTSGRKYENELWKYAIITK